MSLNTSTTSSKEISNYKSKEIYIDRGMAMHIAIAETGWITLYETAPS